MRHEFEELRKPKPAENPEIAVLKTEISKINLRLNLLENEKRTDPERPHSKIRRRKKLRSKKHEEG